MDVVEQLIGQKTKIYSVVKLCCHALLLSEYNALALVVIAR